MAREGQIIDQEFFPLCEEADHPLMIEGMCLCGAARIVGGAIEVRDRRGRLLALLCNTSVPQDRNGAVIYE